MGAHQGCVGLAAPQLDELVRMVVVDVSEHPRATKRNGLLVLVNPEIVLALGRRGRARGLPEHPGPDRERQATRPRSSSEASTPTARAARIESEGFEARCLLHEIDHLDGILFLDRVDSLKTDVFRRKSYA